MGFKDKRLAPFNGFKPSGKIFYWPFQSGISFVDHLCFCVLYLIVSIPDLCTLYYFVFLMLFRLFFAALRPPAGKGLTSWLLLVMFIVLLLLSHVVSWVRSGTWLYRFLIFASFLTIFKNNIWYLFDVYEIYKSVNGIINA